jgi:hypothetical protein
MLPLGPSLATMDSTNKDAWTFLTGHGHVLVEIARHPDALVREISRAAGVTERTASSIIADLEAAGYITRTRIGRRTRYTVHADAPFRHKGQEGHLIGPLLHLLTSPDPVADTTVPAAP